MNYMEQVAQLLGVELDEEFEIKTAMYRYKLTLDGLMVLSDYCKDWEESPFVFTRLLSGKLEIEKPILNRSEKKYLENVIRPFKDEVVDITKNRYDSVFEFIGIHTSDTHHMYFPNFKIGLMYKGMKPNKKYTLKELGLFEDE